MISSSIIFASGLPAPSGDRHLASIYDRFARLQINLEPSLRSGKTRCFGEWRLNVASRQIIHVAHPADQAARLTGAEFSLLQVFLDHSQRILTRDQLLTLARGRDAKGLDRSIDLLVSRLRRRLDDDPRRPCYIETVRSAGYLFLTRPQ